ncbi:MAG: S49 family peptidase, partial [Pseudomonadota bacterium]
LSLSSVAGPIEKAFAIKKAEAVALVINSPGGSPVQSRLIYKRIRDRAQETGKTVYAFTEDVAASGGYMLACAGDEIYADPSSIVGSIGVISASFGFDKFIARYDIERRVYTIGENKSMLDPFQPEEAESIARLKTIQKDVHDVFTSLVKDSRGSRLKEGEETLFDGRVWAGGRAHELGLIDGLSDVRTKMRDVFGDKVKLRVVGRRRGLFSSLRGGMMGRAGVAGTGTSLGDELRGLPDEVISAIEARALWARYGL